ncbi:MAG TPA: hypothetical protein VK395_18220 [Gemmataceae bacterium]|nr:hypothetical protein [Gemmataceae bacterium]
MNKLFFVLYVGIAACHFVHASLSDPAQQKMAPPTIAMKAPPPGPDRPAAKLPAEARAPSVKREAVIVLLDLIIGVCYLAAGILHILHAPEQKQRETLSA